jgi:hypothetical protein
VSSIAVSHRVRAASQPERLPSKRRSTRLCSPLSVREGTIRTPQGEPDLSKLGRSSRRAKSDQSERRDSAVKLRHNETVLARRRTSESPHCQCGCWDGNGRNPTRFVGMAGAELVSRGNSGHWLRARFGGRRVASSPPTTTSVRHSRPDAMRCGARMRCLGSATSAASAS